MNLYDPDESVIGLQEGKYQMDVYRCFSFRMSGIGHTPYVFDEPDFSEDVKPDNNKKGLT